MFIIPSEGMTANGVSRLHLRTAAESDLDKLVEYFASLSRSSRYNRFMEPVSNFSRVAFECVVQNRREDGFALVAELRRQGRDSIIGEASYAVDHQTGLGRFAVAVSHDWHGRGLGSALLSATQFRAISLGRYGLFGETLKTNEPMKALACKAGFAVTRSEDRRAIRFQKQLVQQPPSEKDTTRPLSERRADERLEQCCGKARPDFGRTMTSWPTVALGLPALTTSFAPYP
jgi:GNAT superfamily N-acetyltransferase